MTAIKYTNSIIIVKEFTTAIALALTILFIILTMNPEGNIIFNLLIKSFVLYTIYLSLKLYLKTFKDNFYITKQIWKGFSFKVLLKNFGIFLLTLMLVLTINKIPFLSYGWTDFFLMKSNNVFISSVVDLKTTKTFPLFYSLFYLAILLFLIPDFVHFEEQIFRKGKTSFKSRIISSIKFGLIHCIVGVSVGTGIALILPGLYFSKVYKKAYDKEINYSDKTKTTEVQIKKAHDKATITSSTHHALYNTLIISFIFIYILYQIITTINA